MLLSNKEGRHKASDLYDGGLMSLNEWSLIYFAVSAIYMFGIFFSLFTNLTIGKVFFVIVAWLANVSITLVYGIATSQVGFMFLSGLELVITMLMFIQFGRLQNEDSNS